MRSHKRWVALGFHAQSNPVMSVVPLTLTISLCLVFTFVIFFLREQSRHPFSSSERESLLPLADETPRAAGSADRGGPDGSDDCNPR